MKLTKYYNKIENLIESLNFQIDDLNEEIEMIEQKSLDAVWDDKRIKRKRNFIKRRNEK